MRLVNRVCFAVLASLALAGSALGANDRGATAAWPGGTAVVTYTSPAALSAALERHPAQIVRHVPSLGVAAVRPAGSLDRFARLLAAEPGIARVERSAARRSLVEPALAFAAPAAPLQWQYEAVHADQVPAEVAAAAAGVTIAVIDTGADLTAPDLSSKAPTTYSIRSRQPGVADANGHGTFVAALAAGSSTNGDGIAGVAGEAGLMVVQAGSASGAFTDVDEAAAIVYAVDHGAKILNLSLGGPTTSSIERRAVDYAVAKGALLVAAVGNGYQTGNDVEYPAALLQPLGSRGVGGRGLSVAASTSDGAHAWFSSSGSHVSLAAPGVGVFSALSTGSSEARYPRTPLPGSLGGIYGYGSGTSFAAPQVAGAAALVWAANPALRADEVASVLEQSASGQGSWTPELGFGVLDVAAAVARAQRVTSAPLAVPASVPVQIRLSGRRIGNRVALSWRATGEVASYRLAVRTGNGRQQVLAGLLSGRSATYSLGRGLHRFTVTALDAVGRVLAVSAPWSVRVPAVR